MKKLLTSLVLFTIIYHTEATTECRKLPRPANGNVYYLTTGGEDKRTYPVGYTVLFACDEGYSRTGTLYRSCTSNGRWSGTRAQCQAEPCSRPSTPANGGILENQETFQLGEEVTFQCNPGYELNGINTATCLVGSIWSYPVPTCDLLSVNTSDSCGDPGYIMNGTRTVDAAAPDEEESLSYADSYPDYDPAVLSNSPPVFTYGSVVTFTCNPRFELVGESTLSCLVNGNWSAALPHCEEVEIHCPPLLEEIEHGNSTVEDRLYKHNEIIRYSCSPGYRVKGAKWRVCDTYTWNVGRWTDETPRCEEIRCPNPGNPEHGTKIGTSYKLGDTVTFRCDTRYTLYGSESRTCMGNGKWNGTLTICDNGATHCPNPGTPINGRKIGRRFNVHNTVRYRCNRGYVLVGSQIRECLTFGKWSGEEVTCEDPDDFDDINEVVPRLARQFDILQMLSTSSFNISNNVDANISRGRSLDLTNPGGLDLYFLLDASASVGLENFKIGLNFVKKLVEKVGVSPDVGGTRVGALTYGSDVIINFHLSDDLLSTEQVLVALNTIKYGNHDGRRGTATKEALRAVLEIMIPQAEATLNRPLAKKALFLITDGQSNIGGNPASEAEKLKEFDVDIHCVGISNADKKQLVDIASRPTREHLFFIEDYEKLEWLISEITNTEVDYSPCGEAGNTKLDSRARIIAGNDAAEGAWPWQAAIFRKRPNDKTEIFCGGSLISRNWVLSAAHCFHNPLYTLNAQDIQIRLGVSNRKEDDITKPKVQYFDVDQLIVYDRFDYDSWSDNIDYDIALLHLDHTAALGPFVRTVCLPDSDEFELPEELITTGKFIIVTGWGHETPRHRDDEIFAQFVEHLQQVPIPIQEDDTCTNSLREFNHADHFTSRMFCAGFGGVAPEDRQLEEGEGIRDACQGDSGGPAVREILGIQDNKYRFVQIGVVSWGEGCAQEGQYGYYTNIPFLMRWISQQIDEPEEGVVEDAVVEPAVDIDAEAVAAVVP